MSTRPYRPQQSKEGNERCLNEGLWLGGKKKRHIYKIGGKEFIERIWSSSKEKQNKGVTKRTRIRATLGSGQQELRHRPREALQAGNSWPHLLILASLCSRCRRLRRTVSGAKLGSPAHPSTGESWERGRKEVFGPLGGTQSSKYSEAERRSSRQGHGAVVKRGGAGFCMGKPHK